MKYFFTIILFSLTIYAQADTATANTQTISSATIAQASDASIEELLIVTQIQEKFQDGKDISLIKYNSKLADTLKAALKSQFMTEADLKISKEAQTKLHTLVSQEITWDKTKSIIKKSYRQFFNQSEMDAFIAFYKSAAGQALIKQKLTLDKDIHELRHTQLKASGLQPLYAEIFANTEAAIEANHTK